MSNRHFLKMHGLGNDFVVFDARRDRLTLDRSQARALADRHRGVGCDQVVVIEPPLSPGSDATMRIWNADGGEVEACGNAARCVASLIMGEGGRDQAAIDTAAGPVAASRSGALIAIDMGLPRTEWRDIPLAEAADTLALPIAEGPLSQPVAVSMGNPHAVFFVKDVAAIDLACLGPRIEHHPLFPMRTNVEIVEIRAPDRLRVRVWERGAGVTLACGTGACASLVAASRRGLAGRKATIALDGGELEIAWREDGHVIMTGPVATSFAGEVDLDRLDRAPA